MMLLVSLFNLPKKYDNYLKLYNYNITVILYIVIKYDIQNTNKKNVRKHFF